MSEAQFDWTRLGDVSVGRENLGPEMPVVVYRLMQYTIMDTLVESYGREQADEQLRRAGHRTGMALAQNALNLSADFDQFAAHLQQTLKSLKIGILRFEDADLENMRFMLTVDEDLDCSGLPVTGETVCIYDEGFIAGIFEAYTGKKFDVKEIDCWASGDRTCRFTANHTPA